MPKSFNRVLELVEKEFEGLQWDHFDRKKFTMAPIYYWPSDVPFISRDLDQVLIPPHKSKEECNFVALSEQSVVLNWCSTYWYTHVTIEELMEDVSDVLEHVLDNRIDMDRMDVDKGFGMAEPG